MGTAPMRHEDYLVGGNGKTDRKPLPSSVYTAPVKNNQPHQMTPGGIFTPATNSQGYTKIGIYGPQGCGKSTTAALIAIALSKMYHNSAPVFMKDTENGSDFLAPLFEIEGVPFLTRKSRSFRDMCAGLYEAQKAGACCYIEDSLTTDWTELLEAFKTKRGITEIQFYHWGQIKPQWQNEWVVPMLNAQMHVIVAGRAGDVWEQVANEEGKLKAERVGTKMKAEGEFGYEPNLLIEMESVRKLEGGRRRGGKFVHRAYVLKDRTRRIQGKEFEWPDINGYKAGQFNSIFSKIQPHVDFFNVGQAHSALDATASSTDLFDAAGNAEYHRKKQERQIMVEEVEGNLVAIFPGQDAKSKKYKADSLEILFGTRSWTKIAEQVPVGNLEVGLARLRNLRSRLNGPLDDDETVQRTLRDVLLESAGEEEAAAEPVKA